MKDKDILITGLQSWDIQIGSNCKNIAQEFAKQNRVLYVNPPLDRLSIMRKNTVSELALQRRNQLVEVADNLWVYYPMCTLESISRLPIDSFFDALNMVNNMRFAKSITSAMARINFNPTVHFCDSDMFRSLHLKKLLNTPLFVYYSRDNLLAVKFWKTQGQRIEPQIMQQADVVMTNSEYLTEIASEHNSNSYFVGQGCDLSSFKKNTNNNIPPDLQHIQSPKIGYIGALKALRLDIGILENIAQQRSDWNLVLVGPEDDTFKKSKLHQMPNVYFLGNKQERELPNYLEAFDVAINPQRVNLVTIGNYPRKIDEYLAMGKPVVATQTKAMEYFSNHCSLATTNNEWLINIETELTTDTTKKQEQRMQFAQQHSWGNNVETIYNLIEKHIGNEYKSRNKKERIS